jgi:uncharacterized protein (TIGR03089 family)
VPAPATPDRLLRSLLVADPARPFLTHYDDASGERVELSVTTFENWVAKTAGLLVDGLDVEPGDRVAIVLPLHWQALVWFSACWATGAVAVAGSAADVPAAVAGCRVVVAGPDELEAAAASAAGDASVVGLSLRPLGAPFPGTAPAGAIDYGREVLGYPDRFLGAPPEGDAPALFDGGTTLTAADIVASAQARVAEWRLPRGSRILSSAPLTGDGLHAALTVPLVLDGSAVLCRHLDPAGLAARVDSEHVTAALLDDGDPPAGVRAIGRTGPEGSSH